MPEVMYTPDGYPFIGEAVNHDPFAPQDNSLSPLVNDRAAARVKQGALHPIMKQPVQDDRSAFGKFAADALLGRNGVERFQTFPERWARAGIREFGRAASGKFPDIVYGDMVSDEDMAKRSQELGEGVEGATNFVMLGGPAQMAARGVRAPGSNTLSMSPGAGPGKVAEIAPRVAFSCGERGSQLASGFRIARTVDGHDQEYQRRQR